VAFYDAKQLGGMIEQPLQRDFIFVSPTSFLSKYPNDRNALVPYEVGEFSVILRVGAMHLQLLPLQ